MNWDSLTLFPFIVKIVEVRYTGTLLNPIVVVALGSTVLSRLGKTSVRPALLVSTLWLCGYFSALWFNIWTLYFILPLILSNTKSNFNRLWAQSYVKLYNQFLFLLSENNQGQRHLTWLLQRCRTFIVKLNGKNPLEMSYPQWGILA